MADWTMARVQDRLELAADVMKSLPAVRPQGFFNAWPEYFHSFADQVGQEPRMRKPLPSPRMITEADAAMLWLRWVEKDIAQILWARANRSPWKKISWEHGISRAAANRRHEYGLAVIVWRLNGKTVPRKRSRRFVVENADRLSRKIVM
ncbi:hypothetical protein HUK65_15675 [Rhodobacteraceae bacterium 2376]|uniref:DUF6362 domain-containing protein n=1 Tax=Rhabdonatronobacter sediminivivens TaxID=2743469 RepID=A0A7Z0I1X2_9RHOB|nr:DUF6362 family protein [Rhabdonatronobacter sediminivivens]NYS26426.1 hypothetical protein [Rhabdonatronobacter sediminivivens]